MSKSKISIEAWFALCGLFLGIAFLLYRASYSTANVEKTSPRDSGEIRSTPGDSSSGEAGTPVTLGSPVTINQVTTPNVQSPDADPLLPPTSPQLDAVLALKYYLLSDAYDEAQKLFTSVPESSRDLVVRSALYAVWERGEAGKGDWFMGATFDPYTSRQSSLQMGNDPIRNIDTADAPVTAGRIESEIALARKRISETHKLLRQVDTKTQAYWMPYLVVKLRRLQSEGSESLMNQLLDEGNAAITSSLKEFEVESKNLKRWSKVTDVVSVVFPLVLSALGFVFAKISQSTLAAIDRWLSARWSTAPKTEDKAAG